MIETFKTLFCVRSSLISLYLALTIPIPFISIERFKIPSIIAFFLGLFLIINITNDYVNTCDKKVSYKTSFISKILGKENWEILWRDIKQIKSFPTSQGSLVHYFITDYKESFLVPQRIENFEKFISVVEEKTNLDISKMTYISPLWTYKFLTYLSLLVLIVEIISLKI